MTLPASGTIALSQVNTELGSASTSNISLNQVSVRALFGVPAGAIAMSNGYGKSSVFNLTNSIRLRTTASSYLGKAITTPTNNKIFTFSAWMKRGAPAVTHEIFTVSDNVGNARTTLAWYNDNLFAGDAIGGSSNLSQISLNLYRDYSGWYHVVWAVDTTQAVAANRSKLYVNGVQVTSFTGSPSYPAQNNAMGGMVSGYLGRIGAYVEANVVYYPYDGLFADTYFVDGQALAPTSFGKFDSTTGVWTPTNYAGTYGNNGFHLPFTDTSSLTTSSNVGLGKDFSGNGNFWTTTNVSLTAGTTYDGFTDVPTLTSATASNFATMNPIDAGTGVVLSNGNLTLSVTAAGGGGSGRSTIGAYSGKIYVEFVPGHSTYSSVGICLQTVNVGTNTWFAQYPGSVGIYNGSGAMYKDGSIIQSPGTFTTADTMAMALDLTNLTLQFYKNNALFGSAVSITAGTWFFASGNYSIDATLGTYNFGQRPFTYTPPAGFVSLNTYNLPTPAIIAGNQYFDATLWNGNSAAQTITNAGSFAPDLVWTKSRNDVQWNNLNDTTRGINTQLYTNSTNVETAASGTLTSFNSNGFTLTSYDINNKTGDTFVGWQWKKGVTPGFDVVAYTGNGTSQPINHALTAVPKFMIVKGRSLATNWSVYHSQIGGNGAGNVVWLNLMTGYNNTTTYWNNTTPTTTQFYVGASGDTNNNGSTYIAYLWSEIAGFSKFGSYTGNGLANGPFTYLGFRAKFIMVKDISDANGQWVIWDTIRDTFNIVNNELMPNSSAVENTSSADCDIVSNGFKIRRAATNFNTSGITFIYAAFAENPFRNALAR